MINFQTATDELAKVVADADRGEHTVYARPLLDQRPVTAGMKCLYVHVTAESIVLVATDGEWTRRAVGSRKTAFELARSLDIPVYDVLLTGYPKRMREWSSKQRRGQA